MSGLTHFVRFFIETEGEKFYLTNDCVEIKKSSAHLFTIDDWRNMPSPTNIKKEELEQDELMRLNGQPELFEASQ